MVDVSPKLVTSRTAAARATVKVGQHLTMLIKENNIKKGDVLSVAQVAGILGAKQTSEIIPLCHNIPLSSIKVKAKLDEDTDSVIIESAVKCDGKTGVEMEALTAVSVAALTVYDMCKSVTHGIEIVDIVLLSKSGGARGDYVKDGQKADVRAFETSPIEKKEPVYLGIHL